MSAEPKEPNVLAITEFPTRSRNPEPDSDLDALQLELVLATNRRHSHEAGYRRAIADVLAAAVFVAEKSLRTAPSPGDGRQVIYRFLELLERETVALSDTQNLMSDGAGI